MPPERSRSLNPQGRQKSCSECARAKRRCDLRQPNCLRCSRQNLTCSYPPQPSSAETPASHNDGTLLETNVDNSLLELDAVGGLLNCESVELLDFDFMSGANAVQSLNDMLNDDVEETFPVARSFYASGNQFSLAHISSFAHSRLAYSIEQTKLAPAMMVAEKYTPWSHSCLYDDDMPRSLQDAHAACALYISKNDTNTNLITRHINDRAQELVESQTSTLPLGVLARAHALLLYQIMLVFGGDIRSYRQVEANIPHIEATCEALRSLIEHDLDPSGPLPLYPAAAARVAWRSFIFRESARRTLLILFHFKALCNLLSGHVSSCSHSAALGNRVNFSAHLWKANSAFDFALAWNEKNHFLVEDLDCTHLLEAAKADDIDVFGKVILTGMMGVDDMKGWFHTRGGML